VTGTSRVLVAAVVRIVLLAVAVWFAVAPAPLGPETPLFSRIALVVLALVLSILVGEIVQMRLHLGLLVGALRQLGPSASGAAVAADVEEALRSGKSPVPAAERAVPILIQALEGKDESARRAAHDHLCRLTGQSLPPEAAAWRAWWKDRERGGA
jgi:hypothetical protein